jgi:hypothetical protein
MLQFSEYRLHNDREQGASRGRYVAQEGAEPTSGLAHHSECRSSIGTPRLVRRAGLASVKFARLSYPRQWEAAHAHYLPSLCDVAPLELIQGELVWP